MGAGVAVIASLAGARPLRLAPSTPWVVDYAENSCRLIRHFGQGKDATIFALESEAPGAEDMLIAGKPMSTFKEQVAAKFSPLQAKPMLGLPAETTDKRDPVVLWSAVWLLPDDVVAHLEKEAIARNRNAKLRPPPISLAEQAARKAQRQAFAETTTAIEVDVRPDRRVILETGSLGEPIKMFDQCSRNSLRDWGVNPDVEDKIVRPVWAPAPWAWFKPSDYPNDMLMRGQQSVVKVRLLIDAAGRVTKCTSLSHFNAPQFDKLVCDNFIARAQFEPAELADGTKVPSYYVNKVIFMIDR